MRTGMCLIQLKYDADGGTKSETYYTEDGVIRCEDEVNETGIKRTWYKNDGSIESVTNYEYEYNSEGNKAKCKSYDENGTLKEEYEYDDSGLHVVSKISYDEQGNVGIQNRI